MNIFSNIKQQIITIIEDIIDQGILPDDVNKEAITVEPPRDLSHGDAASNAAMVIAKKAGMKPVDLAKKIAAALVEFPNIDNASVAGPGFINMKLNTDIWQHEISNILNIGESYGNCTIGEGARINVEYVSANPTGPMHIGHARGAVFGDALANLLAKAGYDIVREYYINDAGGQIGTLVESAYLRYKEACGEKITIPEGLYPGEYLIPIGSGLKQKYDTKLLNDSAYFAKVKEFTLAAMMELIKKDLSDLGINHDVFTSEQQIQDAGKIEEGLKILQQKGLVYKGILEKPKGQALEDWEEREQILFKSTKFADDVDRPLQKSDGSWTYFASDIAYHLDKIQRGFNKMTVALGVDHGGYVKRLKAAVNALSDGKAQIDVKLYALVNFLENGLPLKMSKRAGNFTTVRDVIDAVGKDVIRFIMLTRKNDVVIDFDLTKVKEQSKDNPVFYVQYAHARACSVLRHAKDEAKEAFAIYKKIDDKLLAHIKTEDELQLVKAMASWPRVVEAAAIAGEPHRIAFYLQDLAAIFHALWNKGKDDAVLRFIIADQSELTAARLAMIKAFSVVIASGLAIFNIMPLQEMR